MIQATSFSELILSPADTLFIVETKRSSKAMN